MEQNITLDNMFLNVQSDITTTTSLDITYQQNDGITEVNFHLLSDEEILFPKLEVTVQIPLIDIHNAWTTSLYGNYATVRNKGLTMFQTDFETKISKDAPVCCYYDLHGNNRLSAALSETVESVKVNTGVYEELTSVMIRFTLFDNENLFKKRDKYNFVLRLDTRDIKFDQSIQDITRWYEDTLLGNSILPVPSTAFEPVFSTWYNFHQNLFQNEVEEQCALAAEVGCKTVIVDDGWQTDDSNRGYDFCGDWQVSKNRFPDFESHVKTVQDMGLKYLLWMSVPFVGPKADIYNELKDYGLYFHREFGALVLDPRYPRCREHIVGTCKRLMRDYNLDGMKLDFIDSFDMKDADQKALSYDPERDTESLQEAVTTLLTEIRTTLESIKPNVLIEFRQRYVGPMIRTFGNMIRVHDCPHDSVANRFGIMDLRLFSGNTAVHSDMFIWDNGDTSHSTALQFINTLFGVPQLSINMKNMNAKQNKLTKHWLSFWTKNKDVLMFGDLSCERPDLHYSVVKSHLDKQSIVTVHINCPVQLFEKNEEKITIINGGLLDEFIIKMDTDKFVHIRHYDCFGELANEYEMILTKGLNELDVLRSGYLILQANN